MCIQVCGLGGVKATNKIIIAHLQKDRVKPRSKRTKSLPIAVVELTLSVLLVGETTASRVCKTSKNSESLISGRGGI